MEITSLKHRFATIAEAEACMREIVDRPIPRQMVVAEDRLTFTSFTHILPQGRFTNIYDISFDPRAVTANIHIGDELEGVYEYIERTPTLIAATSGPFFCHIDQNEGVPHQPVLNLAIANGQVKSLPVVDREAVLCMNNTLVAKPVQAVGIVSFGGTELTWAGSSAGHDADCVIFGNGNLVVERVACEINKSKRIIASASRYTPVFTRRDMVDVGFIPHPAGGFVADSVSDQGGMDICRYAFIGRLPKRYIPRNPGARLHVLSIDDMIPGRDILGGFTTGPMLNADFATHPIHQDRSLGPLSPLTEYPAARMVLYETTKGRVHIRIFDGRPGSEIFQGVTPTEALSLVHAEGSIRWGCFLDGGHTARTCIRQDKDVKGYGNAHYLTLPSNNNHSYTWAGKRGRPTAGIIALG